MKKGIGISGIFLIFILSISCNKEKPVIDPTVTTTSVTEVLYATATSGGIISDVGGGFISARGVCWGTGVNPATSDSKTADGPGAGQFISSIHGLELGTLYHVRAYAINSAGTVYGNDLSFRTKVLDVKFNASLTYGTVTDIDGKNYKTIPIGSQVWMAENLKTSKLNDGTDIPLIVSNSDWSNVLTTAYCWFDNNDTLYGNIYGAYYSWFAVNTGKLCPAGWHVPSDDEWQQLVDNLGGNLSAGTKIKETGTNNWLLPNQDASNVSGFTGLPAGMRSAVDGAFNGQGYYGGWWTATETGSSPLGAAWSRWIHGDTTVVARSEIFKKDGFSVRCVKDQI